MSKMRFIRSHTPATEFWTGARDIIPLVIGAVPFGIIFGTLATNNGLSPMATLAMSVFVFAGSSQFIAAGMVALNTSWLLIVLTTFVVNLRHLLYAVSLLPHVTSLSQKWKISLGFLLTDEAFAIAIRHYETSALKTSALKTSALKNSQTPQKETQENVQKTASYKHWYFFGAALTMYLNWQLSTLLGITIGQLIPNAASWGLDFAMSVTFIGMIVPYVKHKPMLIAVLVSGAIALFSASFPHKLGLMLAAFGGISAGVISERMLTQSALK
ncbi:MAG: AzlC family ABC transporter permease [Cyanobacteria bacterium J06650_10]